MKHAKCAWCLLPEGRVFHAQFVPYEGPYMTLWVHRRCVADVKRQHTLADYQQRQLDAQHTKEKP